MSAIVSAARKGGPTIRAPHSEGIRTRPLIGADATAAAELAVRVLGEDSRLAQLGRTFLAQLFRTSLQHEKTLAARAVDSDGHTLGYVLASADIRAFRRFVQPRLALAMLRALLHPRRVSLMPNMVRGLQEAEPEPAIAAELLLLFVHPEHQREGAGRELVQWLDAAFKRRGIARYRVAVRSQLVQARAFYEAVGFVHEQELPALGEPMTYFVRGL